MSQSSFAVSDKGNLSVDGKIDNKFQDVGPT